MAEEYIKAQDIPGFAEFPEQLQRLLSVPSQEYSSKGFLLQTDSPVYCLSYTTHQYKAKYMFYSEKCLVTLDTSLAPKSIDIDTFKCFGHEKGSGRKLLCYALTWIQKELGLPSQTSVLLQADPTYRNNIKEAVNKASEAKNEGEEERIVAAAMESLKAYYRKYGFKGKGSNMEAKLETILGSCQSGGGCDEFLNLLSICDAIHDFKTEYPRVKKSLDIILNGLKCSSLSEIDDKYIKYPESSLIKQCIGYDDIDYLIGDLESSRYTKNIEIFNRNYNIKLLHIRRGNVIKYLDRMSDIREQELIDFFGSENVNILYDAGINALKVFSTVNKERLTINQVINREYMNDSSTGKSTSALNTIPQLIDTEQNTILYDKTSKFNTKYILGLDKLNNHRIRQMEIHFTIKDNDKLLYESQHGSWNSRSSCIDYLERSTYKNDVIYQIKRSGDWLQALSCIDTLREYNGNKENLGRIILMTFDRVLLIYALFLGLDVLFTNKDQEVIYFKSLEVLSQEPLASSAAPPQAVSEPTKPSAENILDVMKIMNEYTRRENRGISDVIAEKQFYIRFIDLLKSKPMLREQLRNYISKGKPESMEQDTYDLITKALAMKGGSITEKKLCNDYLTELKSDIECFDSEDNSDYGYYEKTALVVLACLNEYRTSANVYEQMQAILFDILPSIEGYIKCKEPEIQQFFNDDYVADCTSYAARNIALHSLGLRTGKLESLGNREKHSVKIPPSVVNFYKRIEKHLEKSTFEERKEWIIEQLQVYHDFLHSSKPKKSSRRKLKKKSSTRKRSSPKALVIKGGTRKKL